MATVNNIDVIKFPLDAYKPAPIYQGEQQLSVPRILTMAPTGSASSAGSATTGQLWPIKQ